MATIKNKIRRILLTEVGTNNGTVRQAWILDALKSIPAGKSLLDAGAGECQFKDACSHLKYVSQDFGQYNAEGSIGIQMKSWDNTKLDIVGDITDIDVPDESFDVILCTEVFEHIPDPLSALKEFSRILKPGGELILTAPFCSMTHFAPYHFCTGFSRFFYETNLKKFGFEITELHSNGSYFDFVAQDIKNTPFVVEKYTHKKINIIEKFLFLLTLRILNKYRKIDNGSKELLCFGFQVRAIKK